MNQPPAMIVQLIHIQGPLKGKIQEFSASQITIGRHPSCDLQFPRDLVVISRNHARITREGNRFKIIDQSTNGTFVNGEKISETYLRDGDVIFFTEGGPKVSFLTRIDETVAAADARPGAPPPQNTGPRMDPPPARPPMESVSQSHSSEPVPQPLPPQPDPVSQPYQPVQSQPRQDPVPQPEIRIEPVKAPLVIQYGALLQSFNQLPVTIGTKEDCDLTLDHPSLVDHHVQIFFSQGSYRIKDLTGRNQIRINNQPIISPAALTPGDKLFLTAEGPAFHFLEGGRMAEITIPSPPVESENNPMETGEKKGSPAPKSKSLFKKFFGS